MKYLRKFNEDDNFEDVYYSEITQDEYNKKVQNGIINFTTSEIKKVK
jgi:hypothetical protein